MTLLNKPYARLVDSWQEEACPHLVLDLRQREKGGYSFEKCYGELEPDCYPTNLQQVAAAEWIAKNLTSAWRAFSTDSTNFFAFENEKEAVLFKLFIL